MDESARQKNSAAYRLAALDPEFLLGDSMRGVRLQLEYEKAEERLRAWVVRSTAYARKSVKRHPIEDRFCVTGEDFGHGDVSPLAQPNVQRVPSAFVASPTWALGA